MIRRSLSLAAALALVASVPALAQQKAPTPAQTAPVAAKPAIPANVFYRGQSAQQYLAKDKLIGASVVDKDGKVIGDIEDLIMGPTNEVEGVVLGVGGFLGAGEKRIGVRYSALKFDKKDNKTTISLPQASKEILAALDPFKRAEPKKSLLERAREKARELGDKTKETSKPALDKAKEVGKAAVDKSKELGGAAIEKGKQVIDTAKEKAQPKQ